MGKATGFKEFDRSTVPTGRRPIAYLIQEIYTVRNHRTLKHRARGAWIAAYRFAKAIMVAPSQSDP